MIMEDITEIDFVTVPKSTIDMLRKDALFFGRDSSWGNEVSDCDTTSVASEEWETVGESTRSTNASIAPREVQRKWCSHGNACVWRNCPFRHERCTHYDNWVARGKCGYSCKSIKTDPTSCKSPEDGGCKYDHRNTTNLQTYYDSLPCETEDELWQSFESKGIISYAADAYGIEKMARVDKALLIRSLRRYGVDFEDNETWLKINVS